MSNTEQLTKLLTYTLVSVITLLFIVFMVLVVVWLKNKTQENNKNRKNAEPTNGNKNTKKTKSLGENKQSIHKFMEFDTVDDNMIIQDNGKRYLMVVECQGINYDLMSGVEKTGVEQGFIQFLNTLRNPIQIYIQTRSVNLERSIQTYKEKLRKIEEKLNNMKISYQQMKEDGEFSREEIDKAFFEYTKQLNLYEYGKDVINNTERMSLNTNILNKKYYIIVPYYSSELGASNLDKEETQSLVFSELYTRAQSIVSSIAACGVRGKILKSNELIELLYMAYNRDEAEVFGLDKALKAGYDEMYSTAPDVLDKRMRELDKLIDEKAVEKARQKLDEALSEKEQAVKEKEKSLYDLIDEFATLYLEENEKFVGKDVIENAKGKSQKEKQERIQKTKEGGNTKNEKPKSNRGRKPKSATNS